MAELHRYSRPLSADGRTQRITDPAIRDDDAEAIVRTDGRLVDLTAFDNLYTEVQRRIEAGQWPDRAFSDRWLAPRLHHALRLSRAEAADRGTWQWLAVRVHEYVTWRWERQDNGTVVEARWWGPIHKQALARLWWGAEIFRDGHDYRPVERAFIRQDLPNSLLHRPLVRCRSLALGLVEVLAPDGGDAVSADEVNDLARALNLATAGSPPEVETGFLRDGVAGYRHWIEQPGVDIRAWDKLPSGPDTVDTTEQSRSAGRRIAERGRHFAASARSAASRGRRDGRASPSFPASSILSWC